jgi:hypothetical protein
MDVDKSFFTRPGSALVAASIADPPRWVFSHEYKAGGGGAEIRQGCFAVPSVIAVCAPTKIDGVAAVAGGGGPVGAAVSMTTVVAMAIR